MYSKKLYYVYYQGYHVLCWVLCIIYLVNNIHDKNILTWIFTLWTFMERKLILGIRERPINKEKLGLSKELLSMTSDNNQGTEHKWQQHAPSFHYEEDIAPDSVWCAAAWLHLKHKRLISVWKCIRRKSTFVKGIYESNKVRNIRETITEVNGRHTDTLRRDWEKNRY